MAGLSSIRARLIALLTALALLIAGGLGGGWWGVMSMHDTVATIHDDRVVPLRDLKAVSDFYAVRIVDTSHKVRDGGVAWSTGLRDVETALAMIEKRWSAFKATAMSAHETALSLEAEHLMRRATPTVEALVDLLRSQDAPGLKAFTARDLYPAIDPISEAISKLVDLQLDIADSEAKRSDWIYGLLSVGFLTVAAIGFLAISIAARTVWSGVSVPLGRIADQMQRLAGGDLTLVVGDIHKRDEIGTLARALQVFQGSLIAKRDADAAIAREADDKMRRVQHLDALTRSFEADVSSLSEGVSSAATEMEATAAAMSGTANETNLQSVSVASTAQQTSANVQTVAAATEELAASVQEIAGQVAHSSSAAAAAGREAERTDAIMRTLAAGTRRIGDVVGLISGIASQTNLLALNATIEAARAGEAGRGFAVVATEVKALAEQTTRATGEIASQITTLQTETEAAVSAIAAIGRTIGEMNAIASGVAAAMEEQGAATREIARNVQEAARGTQSVTETIMSVRDGASGTGAAAAQVLGAAQELSRTSEQMRRQVNAFLSEVRAA